MHRCVKPSLVCYLALLLMAAFLAGPALDLAPLGGWAMAADPDPNPDPNPDPTPDPNDPTNPNTVIIGGIPGAGVVINAQGVLTMKAAVDATGKLDRRRRQQAQAALNADLARPSELRKVSLNRLEQALQQQLAQGQGPTDDMLYLAGLTELQYVFFYPETKDIVIAGPAEGFMLDDLSRPVGSVTGQAVLQLEDLLVALRATVPAPSRWARSGSRSTRRPKA